MPAENSNVKYFRDLRITGSKGFNHAKIEEITIYPGYNVTNNDHNLAVLEIKEPLVFSNPIQSINLLPTMPPIGSKITVSGFGANDLKNPNHSSCLLSKIS